MDSAMNGTHSAIMTFREDGLREPPLFTASNNLVIMVIGLSILIVPVVGFLICMCARTKFFHAIKNLKLTGGDGSGEMPYSQFEDDEPKHNAKVAAPQDFRVLIQSDNATSGSPARNKNSKVLNTDKFPSKADSSSSLCEDEFSTIHPTFFVVPGQLSPAGSGTNLSSHS